MSFGELLKFVHIVAAVVWVGGPVVVEIVGHRSLKQGGEAVVEFGRLAEQMGSVFGTASFVVLGFGIWLTFDRPYISFGDGWISVALVLTAVLTAAGPAFFGPQSKAIVAEGTTLGGDDPVVVRRVRRFLKVAHLDTLIAFFVVFLMVARPWS